jgi:hypothetical protein
MLAVCCLVVVQASRLPAAGTAAPQGKLTDAPTPASETELRIFLMTLSPGPIIYERFGHNTLVVHDPDPSAERLTKRMELDDRYYRTYGEPVPRVPPLLPTDRAHHYGAFDFKQKGFVPRFIMGRMQYWTTSDWADLTALLYANEGRGVLLQELNLSPAQKIQLKQFLEWNEQPENKFYRYDYYRDNCSTRVRDAIDQAVGGELKRQLHASPTGTTFRSHTRRLMAGLDPIDIFWFTSFTYVLGHPVDEPLSAWDECFLPEQLAEHIRTVRLPAGDGFATQSSCKTRGREPVPSPVPQSVPPRQPPRRIIGYAMGGMLIGGAFAGLARLANRSRVARIAFALLVVPWILIWGVGGSIAAYGWAVTDHTASYRNENLMQASPLMLPLLVLAPTVAFGRRRGQRLALVLAMAGAALSVLGLLLKVLPAFWQHNGEIIALMLPANLGLAAALWLLIRRQRIAIQSAAPHKVDPSRKKKAK